MTYALLLLVCGLSLNDCRVAEHPETFASRAECIDAVPEAIEAAAGKARRTECVRKER
jgi:hypothetical protein